MRPIKIRKDDQLNSNKEKNSGMIDVAILSISIIVICIIALGATARAAINDEVWHEDIRQPTLTQDIKSTPTPTPTATPKPLNEQAVDIAKLYIGVPYVWGGTTPDGFDCSGLVQYAYRQIGINISRTTYTQVNDGYYVAKDSLRKGDLVFFGNISSPHHVGIYIGNGQIIHAPQTGDVIKISSLSDRSDYACARRIVE